MRVWGRRLFGRAGALCLVIAACSWAFGQPGEQSDSLSYSDKRLLRSLGMPTEPVKSHALFFVQGGAASGRITTLPPVEAEKEVWLSKIAELCRELPGSQVTSGPHGAVVIAWGASRFGSTRAEVNLPLSALAAWSDQQGAAASFVLETARHITVTPSLSSEKETRSAKIFVVRHPADKLKLSASISGWHWVGLMGFLWPTLALAAAHISSTRSIGRLGQSAPQREQIRTRFFIWGHFWAVLPTAFTVIPLVLFGGLDSFCDLWLGSSRLAPLLSALLILTLVFIPAGLSLRSHQESQRLDGLKQRVSEDPSGLPNLLDAQTLRGIRLKLDIRAWSPLMLVIILLAAGLLFLTERQQAGQGILLGSVPLLIIGFLFTIDPRRTMELPQLREVQEMTDTLAARLRISRTKVVPEVLVSRESELVPNDENSLMTVSGAFLRTFSLEEQKFLIAEHLLKRKLSKLTLVEALLILAGSVLIGLLLGLLLDAFFSIMISCLVSFATLGWLKHRSSRLGKLRDFSVEAALMTGSLEAALSAKKKSRLQEASANTETDSEFQKRLEEFEARYKAAKARQSSDQIQPL